MGRMKDLFLKPQRMRCPDCYGTGWIEVEWPRPHANGFNEGYIDTRTEECETCCGAGEIPKICFGCGEDMVVGDGDDDYCEDCRNFIIKERRQ